MAMNARSYSLEGACVKLRGPKCLMKKIRDSLGNVGCHPILYDPLCVHV
jgi:hypothetical protein